VTAPAISDNAAAGRYEAAIDGELAGWMEYVVKHGRLALVHTEVLPQYEGTGVGSGLVRFALDQARRREMHVIAICPFVRSYVEGHSETHDLVVGMT